MDTTIADLMRRNRLAVFNGPDAERRNAAIALTYAEDAVRHEPDRVNRGRETLAWRAADLFAQSPDWVMRPDGPVSVNDDLGRLAFHHGPAGRPHLVTGMDIAHGKDGVIIELYTFVDGTSHRS
ncbi:nuclear transport factor 2 family protein [Kitasatospora arboriphila]|uniref:nuclear transport factor 2 family protein n=1 Tax=Kitasatospora arboriphila TaxID=258052 RepID=UPI0031D15BA4